MSWQTRACELIRLGRIHHPDAVQAFLDELETLDCFRYNWRIALDAPVSSLPNDCRSEAQTILAMARNEGLQDSDISSFIQAAGQASPHIKPAVVTPVYSANDLYSPWYESFDGSPWVDHPL